MSEDRIEGGFTRRKQTPPSIEGGFTRRSTLTPTGSAAQAPEGAVPSGEPPDIGRGPAGQDIRPGVEDYLSGSKEALERAPRDLKSFFGDFAGNLWSTMIMPRVAGMPVSGPARSPAITGLAGQVGDIAAALDPGVQLPGAGRMRPETFQESPAGIQAGPLAGRPQLGRQVPPGVGPMGGIGAGLGLGPEGPPAPPIARPAPGPLPPSRQLPAPGAAPGAATPSPGIAGRLSLPSAPRGTMGPGDPMSTPPAPERGGQPGDVFRGRQEIRQPTPTRPILPEGVERGPPSQLASAFVSNDPSFPNRMLTRQFRTLSGFGRRQARSGGRLDMQDQQISTSVDALIEAKDRIQFRDAKDPTGQTLLPSGRIPQNLDQFVQGIDQLKKQIYQEYDQMTTRVGGQGVRVDLGPTAEKLEQLAVTAGTEDITPAIADQALALAQRLRQRGSYTPTEAQETIQAMNAQLRNFLSGKPSQEVFSHPTLINQARDTLLNSLNSTMETALGGPEYQVLRNRYSALTAIEGNVANALAIELSKKPGLFSKGISAAELYGLLHGAFTLNPKVVGSVAALEASRQITRYLYSPNRAVSAMFNSRQRQLSPSFTDALSARAAVKLGEMRQQRYDALRRGDNVEYRELLNR